MVATRSGGVMNDVRLFRARLAPPLASRFQTEAAWCGTWSMRFAATRTPRRFSFSSAFERQRTPDNEMFRFGYYIIGKKPKMKGKWVWGQAANATVHGPLSA
jgi:hypothetical protein